MNDLISRQAAIDALERGAWGKEWDKTLAKAMIESVPSAQPERKKGKWLGDNGPIACSVCHIIWLYRRTDYCPNCGADMRGGEEDGE